MKLGNPIIAATIGKAIVSITPNVKNNKQKIIFFPILKNYHHDGLNSSN